MGKLITIISLIFLFFGCKKSINDGHVILKRHEPARTFVMLIPVSTGKTIMMIPYIYFDDEDFIIKIEKTIDGEKKTNNIYLTESEYNKISIGDYYDSRKCKKQCSLIDEHERKRKS